MEPKTLLKNVTFDFEEIDGFRPHLAYTLDINGGAASGKNVPLVLKGDTVELTEDLFKSLEQVTVKISFEEFLKKFFGLWSDDAEVLAKLMGFKTEHEDYLEQDENLDNDWWQNYVTERCEKFEIMKSANEGKDITLADKLAILEIRKQFEKGYVEPETNSEETPTEPKTKIDPVTTQKTDQTSRAAEVNKTEGTPSTNLENTDITKGEVLDIDSILKSEDAQAVIKGMVDAAVLKATEDATGTIEKQAGTIAKLQEKEDQRVMKGFTILTKSFTSLEEDGQTKLAEFLFKSCDTEGMEIVIDSMKAMQEAVTKAKDAFANGEDGNDGDDGVTDADTTEIQKSAMRDRIVELASAGQL